MLTSLALASLLAVAPAPDVPTVCVDGVPVPVIAVDDELRRLYESGVSYTGFLDAATRRKVLWDRNTEASRGIDMELVRRARAVGGTWRFLVVAVDACSDSVNTVPYLAKLVSMVDGLDMRLVDSDAGRAVMDSHKTPDGRGSTPTMVLLDESWNEAGCFIERPMDLQKWLADNDGKLDRDELFEGKMEWYADDSGARTVAEFVAILEAAAAGRTVCQGR